MGQEEQSIQHVCSFTELKQVRDLDKRPAEFKPFYKTLLSENLGTLCREWSAEKKNPKQMQKYKCVSRPTVSHMTS